VFRLTLRKAAGAGRRRWLLAAAGAAVVCVAGAAAVAVGVAGTPVPKRTPAPRLPGVPVALPAPAATLRQVTSFGPDPAGLRMYLYVPPRVRPHPAVVVVMHYCTGSGPAMFARTEFATLADRYGFIVIYPSAPRPGHCFDLSSLTHDSRYSDPGVIVTMVHWAERHLHADPHRVFATGISSGAEMTAVLLGDYPDVFQAGSVMSGVPFGCFATSEGPAACMHGTITLTAERWGDIVRTADPRYHGPRPRIQLWHGTADKTLYYPNFRDEVEQWVNVSNAALAHTSHPKPGWTHSVYVDRSGRVAVDTYSVAGEDHQLGLRFPGWAQYAISFFGLTPGTSRGTPG
jgi:acetylxylan esterase